MLLVAVGGGLHPCGIIVHSVLILTYLSYRLFSQEVTFIIKYSINKDHMAIGVSLWSQMPLHCS